MTVRQGRNGRCSLGWPMQVPRLRRILQGVVFSSLAGCTGSPFGGDCVEQVNTTLTTKVDADPPTQLKAESCRVDVDACLPLCVAMLGKSGLVTSPSKCDVTFDGDEVTADITYERFNSGGIGCPAEGRRPVGLVEPRRIPAHDAIGAWFAKAAWLESASIHAFLQLAHELGDHGAPRSLRKLAVAAARDEIRHTAIMTALARKYGAEPPKVEVVLPSGRSLEEIAIENAAEGCVRETWGAVVALWQAQTALDPEARAAFTTIARDEVRHAALAWAIDRWAMPQLDHAAQVRVALAREAAVRALAGEPSGELPAIGLPAGDQARQLLSRTYRSLWNGGLS
jgi:rubrerythrin